MTGNTQTIGLTGLPRTIADYLTAHRTRDADTAITCFTNDAAVIDDGKTYHGTAGIHTWLDRSAGEYFRFTLRDGRIARLVIEA
jgi:ketosteroid isomerase-like protein